MWMRKGKFHLHFIQGIDDATGALSSALILQYFIEVIRMRRSIVYISCAIGATCAVLASTPASSASLPSSTSVIAKIVAAYGGPSVLGSIKSTVQVASLTLQGQPGTITVTTERPNKSLEVVAVPAFHAIITTAYDGANGWTSDAYGNVKALSGDQLTSTRCDSTDLTYAMLHPDPTIAFAVQPNQTVDGKSLIALLVSQKDCPTITLLVDPKTYLIARYVSAVETIDFSDYASGPAGEMYPKTAVITGGIGTYYTTVTSIQDNVTIDESIFAMPAAGKSPAPTPSSSSMPSGSSS